MEVSSPTTTIYESTATTLAQGGDGLSGAWIVLIVCIVVLVVVGIATALILRSRKKR